MTYARARLWLGISGVGSLVVLAILALRWDVPAQWFRTSPASLSHEALQLGLFTAAIAAWLLPLDFLGGFWLPRKYGRSEISLRQWLRQHTVTVTLQMMLFVLFGCLLLTSNRAIGWVGVVATVMVGVVITVQIRNGLLTARQRSGAANRRTRSESGLNSLNPVLTVR